MTKANAISRKAMVKPHPSLVSLVILFLLTSDVTGYGLVHAIRLNVTLPNAIEPHVFELADRGTFTKNHPCSEFG